MGGGWEGGVFELSLAFHFKQNTEKSMICIALLFSIYHLNFKKKQKPKVSSHLSEKYRIMKRLTLLTMAITAHSLLCISWIFQSITDYLNDSINEKYFHIPYKSEGFPEVYSWNRNKTIYLLNRYINHWLLYLLSPPKLKQNVQYNKNSWIFFIFHLVIYTSIIAEGKKGSLGEVFSSFSSISFVKIPI